MTELRLHTSSRKGKHKKTYVQVCKACGIKFLTTNKTIIYCCPEHSGKRLCVKCGVKLTKREDGVCWDCSHVSLAEFKKRIEEKDKNDT